MRNKILFSLLVITITIAKLNAQADTIVAFTFNSGNLGDTVVSVGLPVNYGNTIRAEGGAGQLEIIQAANSYALQASNWDNGQNSKFWSIKFKAENYHSLTLYSIQKSDNVNFGPRDWKIQYKLGGNGTWTDIPSALIVCDTTWSGSVISSVPIPVTNHGSTSIFVRWLMTSNTSIDGTDVLSTGKSAIDEIVVLGLPVNIPSQGDTITGWSFSDNNDLNFNADLGLLSNQGFNIRAENESGNVRTLSYVSGAQDFAASATDWDNGQNDKFWSIRFKADGFSDMKISSKQFSDNANPGPKHWKIQTRKSGETWADLTGAENIIVSNNWTSGVVNNIPLPSSFDFPGTTSLFVRWIMTSNEAINGQSVLPTGMSAIDDIIITGINSTGIESIIFKDNIAIYPNPTSDVIIIESTDEMQTVDIFDIRGRRVYSVNIDDSRIAIDISDFNNGIYVVNVIYRNSSKVTTRKIIKN